MYCMYCMYCVCVCVQCWSSCLLYAEAEVEQAVGGVLLPVRSFHLSDETTEALAQLSRRAAKNVFF